MTISSDSLPTATSADRSGSRPLRDLDDLASALSGTMTRPLDGGWDDARAAWQLLVDQQPVAVVTAADRYDIAVTIRAAAALGLRIAPQSTGHNAAPLGDLSRTILVRTSALTRVDVDADRRVAHVGAGAVWGQLSEAAAAADLMAIGGFSADVGGVGLLLGGGLGWFARSHGAAIDSVLACEAITADGVVRQLDAASELFDAILGGADVAVITAVTLRLHPIADVVAGALFWPADTTGEVFHAWAAWSADLPDTVTSVVRVLRFPPGPELPPLFAGRAFTVIEVVIQASPIDADALLEPLRSLAPEIDTVARSAPAALFALHMDPPTPVRALGTTAVLRSLPGSVVDALVDTIVDGPAAHLTSIELRHLGGALDRGPASAVSGSCALLHAVAMAPAPTLSAAPNPAAIGAAEAGLTSLVNAVHTVRSSRDVPSFVEAAACDPQRLFGPQLPELRAAKHRWDPNDLVHANHSVMVTG